MYKAGQAVAALILVVGFFFIFQAFTIPSSFNLTNANAIQTTQVYTMAIYNALMAIAAFILAGVVVLAARPSNEEMQGTLNNLRQELLKRVPVPPSSPQKFG